MARQKSAKGTVGTDLDIFPDVGTLKRLRGMVVNAPTADDDAILRIYKDSAVDANLLFDGYMADRDADGMVFPNIVTSATQKFIVRVTGGSGTLIASALYD